MPFFLVVLLLFLPIAREEAAFVFWHDLGQSTSPWYFGCMPPILLKSEDPFLGTTKLKMDKFWFKHSIQGLKYTHAPKCEMYIYIFFFFQKNTYLQYIRSNWFVPCLSWNTGSSAAPTTNSPPLDPQRRQWETCGLLFWLSFFLHQELALTAQRRSW